MRAGSGCHRPQVNAPAPACLPACHFPPAVQRKRREARRALLEGIDQLAREDNEEELDAVVRAAPDAHCQQLPPALLSLSSSCQVDETRPKWQQAVVRATDCPASSATLGRRALCPGCYGCAQYRARRWVEDHYPFSKDIAFVQSRYGSGHQPGSALCDSFAADKGRPRRHGVVLPVLSFPGQACASPLQARSLCMNCCCCCWRLLLLLLLLGLLLCTDFTDAACR